MTSRSDQMVMKFRDVLAATERLGANELEAYQRSLLKPLLLHARAHAPFYRERLGPVIVGDEVDFARWNEIPILTRAQAQRETAAMTALAVPPHLGAVAPDETSGSTGRPLVFSTNGLLAVAARAMTDRLFRWWGFDGDRTMATFISRRKVPSPAPDGALFMGWRAGHPQGRHHLLDMTADSDQQADWLARVRPDYLTAYSSSLRPLCERVQARGIELSIRKIIGVSSQLAAETRQICREVLGGRVIDQYGADEIGSIATECPHCGLYHVAAESVLVEVVDEAGKPCRPGATGRVVLTPFYAYATIFIRYEIGDYAALPERPPPCPIKLPALGRVVGRFRNVFRLPDGRAIYPLFSVRRLRELVPLQQFQIVQTGYDVVEVRYLPMAAAGVVNGPGLEDYLRQALTPTVKVSAVAVDAIERPPSGKFEDFVSLVGEGA
jgi:phenylacetate-CoA ligase